MNYKLNQSKLENVIEHYLDITFDPSNIGYKEYHDDYGNPSDIAYEFFEQDEIDDIVIFRLYTELYWTNKNDYRINLSPILFFENDDRYSELINLFGDKWIPVFKKWFKKNFRFDIKTVDGYFNS